MNAPYQNDRRAIAWILVLMIVGTIGYLCVRRPELVSPMIVSVMGLVLTAVLALLGVRVNTTKEDEQDDRNDRDQKSRPTYLERLARGAQQDDPDDRPKSGPGRGLRGRLVPRRHLAGA